MSADAEIKARFDAIITEARKDDADRIAQLTAELAEASGIPRQCASLGHTQSVGGFCLECSPHRTPMERLDAAQQRASSAQKELERLVAAHECTKAREAELAEQLRCAETEGRLFARFEVALDALDPEKISALDEKKTKEEP